jgi:hypothetical protein
MLDVLLLGERNNIPAKNPKFLKEPTYFLRKHTDCVFLFIEKERVTCLLGGELQHLLQDSVDIPMG